MFLYRLATILVMDLSPLVAFGGGLLSFLSPCVIPLVPVYLVSLMGPGILEDDARPARLTMFLHSLSFVLGFSMIFIALGTIAGLTGFAISPSAALTNKVAGGLLIALGVFMLARLKVPWLNYERCLSANLGQTTGYLRSFIIGAVFSLGWTACASAVLGGILALALDSATAARGAYLLAVYSFGLGLPFLVAGVAFDRVAPLLRRAHRHSNVAYIISGVLLLAVGVLVLTNNLNRITSIAF